MVLRGSAVELPAQPLVHRVVEQNARRDPDAVAIACGADRLSYAELDARANRFAHHLLSRGIGRGSLVGVCLDRSVELMPTILGVLKAGAAYVPLDPTYPPDRLRLMFTQLSQVRLIAVSGDTRELVEHQGKDVVDVTTLSSSDSGPSGGPEVDVTGDDLCYAVFTSGSTGVPKATAITHRGWYNLLSWFRSEFGLDATAANLMVSSLGFDLSQRSLMTPLFTGATLHLLPGRHLDLGLAHRLIRELGIRTVHCAPSAFYLLVDQELHRNENSLDSLRHAFVGGEPLVVSRIAPWATRQGKHCLVSNQYGPAECTDVALSHPLRDYSDYVSAPIPIGRPIQNVEIRILGEDLTELPHGHTGEICVSGTGVGPGYLNQSPAEMSRFTTVVDGERSVRVYRSGDRGYLNAAGEVVIVGRMDDQVKIRGMRIDLGDVRHALCARRQVKDATVLAVPGEDGEVELVAFVIPDGDRIDGRALRRELFDVLPRNMVPARFVTVAVFPLSTNGKTDRAALAELDRTRRSRG